MNIARATPQEIAREIDRLREHIEALEGVLGLAEEDVALIQRAIGVTRMPAQVLSILRKRRGIISKETLFDALYGARAECDQPQGFKTIEVAICKIRVAIEPRGMEIRTFVGSGYTMEEPTRRELSALMRRYASPTMVHPGDEVLVRGRVVEHYGDDLMVEIEHPRGRTTVNAGIREVQIERSAAEEAVQANKAA